MTNGASIAAEIEGALREAAIATGDGPLIGTLTRAASSTPLAPVPQYPWEVDPDGGELDPGTYPQGTPETFEVTVLDEGIMTRYSRDDGGALIPRTVHAMTVAATGEAPRMGDTITVSGLTKAIVSVAPFGPGGVPLYYDVEVEA